MKLATFICVILGLSLALASSVTLTSNPLEIVILTESLCSDCRDFIVGSYAKAIKAEGLEKIANIVVVPFGNALETQSGNQWNFECQHGEAECLGNALENCLFEHFDKKIAEKVLVCFEAEVVGYRTNWTEIVAKCGQQENVDLSSLLTCASSEEGNQLTHKAALKTDPEHKYVPWVVVNGIHSIDSENEILEDLVRYVCKQYIGEEKIPACENEKLTFREDEPVQIVIATESLCPYCQSFLVSSFADSLRTKDFAKIANVTIVSFGNAQEFQDGDRWNFACQHGYEECYGNAIENCAAAHFDKATANRLLVCFANQQLERVSDWDEVVSVCAIQENLNLSSVLECAKSEEGEELVHQAAQNTDPTHKFVPWVTVNGKYDTSAEDEVFDNLVKYACAKYNGTEKIEACKNMDMLTRSYGSFVSGVCENYEQFKRSWRF